MGKSNVRLRLKHARRHRSAVPQAVAGRKERFLQSSDRTAWILKSSNNVDSLPTVELPAPRMWWVMLRRMVGGADSRARAEVPTQCCFGFHVAGLTGREDFDGPLDFGVFKAGIGNFLRAGRQEGGKQDKDYRRGFGHINGREGLTERKGYDSLQLPVRSASTADSHEEKDHCIGNLFLLVFRPLAL
jgi:hypothetical protein